MLSVYVLKQWTKGGEVAAAPQLDIYDIRYMDIIAIDDRVPCSRWTHTAEFLPLPPLRRTARHPTGGLVKAVSA